MERLILLSMRKQSKKALSQLRLLLIPFLLLLTQDLLAAGPMEDSPITLNPIMWLDASDPDATGTSGSAHGDGSILEVWKDKSGNGKHASVFLNQNTPIYRTGVVNTKPAIEFIKTGDKTGSVYEVAGLDIRPRALPQITIFTVYQARPGGGAITESGLWGVDNGDYDRFFYERYGKSAPVQDGIVGLGDGDNIANIIGSGISEKTNLLTVSYNGRIVNDINSGPVNGSYVAFGGKIVRKFTDTTAVDAQLTKFSIGWDGDGGTADSYIAEILVYDRILTDCELIQVNAYLSKKYGEDFTSGSPGGVLCDGSGTIVNNLWLKADKGIVSDGSASITKWTDQSERSNNALVGAASNLSEVLISTNFNPALKFGAADGLSIAKGLLGNSSQDNVSLFFVAKETSLSSPKWFFREDTSGAAQWSAKTSVNSSLIYQSPEGSLTLNTSERNAIANTIDGQSFISSFYVNNSVDAAKDFTKVLINNKEISSGEAEPLVGDETKAFELGRSITYGSDDDKSLSFDGEIQEVISYVGVVSDQQRHQIQSYLALKYGITLDQTVSTDYLSGSGSIVWQKDTEYEHDIAGLIRDDNSGLDQRISQSANADRLITLATDRNFTAANNDTVRTTQFESGQSLIWSNNNGNATAFTSDNSPDLYSRIAREWKVQNTDTVGKVYIQIDTADPNLKLPDDLKNYALLISPDGTFKDNSTIVYLKKDDLGKWNSEVTFTGTTYFTIATATDEGLARHEVIEDIAGNANGILVTAEQLNVITGVSGAISKNQIAYTTAFIAAKTTDPVGYVDSKNPTAAEIQKIIDAVNKAEDKIAPMLGDDIAIEIAENTPVEVVIVDINDKNDTDANTSSDSDGDSDVITYTVSDTNNFTINEKGELKFVSSPNYENKKTYSVTVTGTTFSQQDTVVVNVTITNVDEVANFTVDGTAAANKNEGIEYTQAFTTAGTTNGKVKWTLTDEAAGFSIDETSGLLTLIAQDFEALNGNNVLKATVVATNNDLDTNTNIFVLTITIDNVDEVANFTVDGTAAANKNEGIEYTQAFTTAGTTNGKVKWTLTDEAAGFSIDETSGLLTLIAQDFEALNGNNVLKATVVATNNDLDTNTNIFVLTITIDNVDEVANFTVDGTAAANKNEGIEYTQAFTTAGTTNGKVKWTLTDEAAGFSIDETSGLLTLIAQDFEALNGNNVLKATVVATNNDLDTNTNIFVLTITIDNVDEVANFTVDGTAAANKNEGIEYTQAFTTAGTTNGKVKWTLTDEAAGFSIDETSGLLTLIAQDFEALNGNNVLKATVVATNNDLDTNTNIFVLTITIDNVDEVANFTVDGTAAANKNEGIEYTQEFTTAGTTNGKVKWTLTDEAAGFSIDETSGLLTLIAQDFEALNGNNVLKATVVATNNDLDTNTNIFVLTITIDNVDEVANFTVDGTAAANKNEGIEYTQAFTTAGTTNGKVKWTLTDEAAGFSIDETSGLLTLIAQDFEALNGNNVLKATVVATNNDLDTNTNIFVLTITIDNVDEVANFTVDGTAAANKNEGIEYTQAFTTAGTTNGKVKWTLTDEAAGFSIDETSGLLTLIAQDFEALNGNNVLKATVVATNNDLDTNTNIFVLTITIDNVDEVANFTVDGTAAANKNEGIEYTQAFTTAGTTNGKVKWTLTDEAAGFSIDETSGLLTLIAQDFEALNGNNVLKATVVATNNDLDTNTNIFVLTITIDNVDEVANFTVDGTAAANKNEGIEYTQAFTTAGTTNGKVKWTLTDEAAGFSIDETSGLLTLIAQDFEALNGNNVLKATVVATNNDLDTNTNIFVLTITIDNVDEVANFTVDGTAAANKNEGIEYTQAFTTAGTTNGKVKWTLTDEAAGFSIDETSGLLTLIAQDFEALNGNNVLKATVVATNNDLDTNTNIFVLTITIDNVDEVANFTVDGTAAANKNEGIEYTQAFTTAGTTNGKVKWTLTDEAAGFSIDETSGLLTLIAQDFEALNGNNVLKATVVATNNDLDTNTNIFVLTITIDNVDEVANFTVDGTAAANKNEGIEYTQAFTTAGTTNGKVKWTLTDEAAGFSIDETSGLLTLIAQDFEALNGNNVLKATVVATNNDLDTNTNIFVLTITIDNVDEVANFTVDGTAAANKNEGIEYTQAFTTAGTTNGKVKWTLTDEAAGFSIDETSGLLTLIAQDFEALNGNNVLKATVVATNNDLDTNTNIFVLTITIDNVDEVANFTVDGTAAANKNEGIEYTQAFTTAGTTNGKVKWTLTDEAAGFSIDETSGLLTLIAQDFEALNGNNVLKATVVATNNDLDTNTNIFVLTITIDNVDEVANFTVDGTAAANKNEGIEYTQAFTTAGTTNGKVKWTLTDEAAGFSIDETSGLLTLIAQDFEALNGNNVLKATVVATNNDLDTNTNIFVLTITIDNVDEVANFTVDGTAAANKNEGIEYTQAFTTAGTTNGKVKWTLTDEAAGFSIDETSGLLTLIAQDFEALNGNNVLKATVVATNNDLDTNTNIFVLTITIDNVDEVANFTVDGTAAANKNEGIEYTQAFTTAGTTNGKVKWTLTDEAAGFSIDETSGLLTLIAQDFEALNGNNVLKATVVATNNDLDTNTNIFVLTITIDNVDEVANFTVDGTAAANKNEGIEYTQEFTTAGTTNGKVKWTLTDEAAGFSIDETSGLLTLIAQDFEALNGNNVLKATVVATNNDLDTNTNTFTLSVTIKNVIESSILILSHISNSEIAENTEYVSTIPKIMGAVGMVSWEKSGADADMFTQESNGQLKMTKKNFERDQKTYKITIKATDADGNKKSKDLIITLTDVDEVEAIFSIEGKETGSVKENAEYSQTLTMTGTPKGTVTWGLKAAVDGFSIDKVGKLTLAKQNFEASETKTRTVIVTLKDEDDTTKEFTVVVTIENLKEPAATFSIKGVATGKVKENAEYIQTLTVIGMPNGAKTWGLKAPVTGFSIDQNGQLKLTGQNFEAIPTKMRTVTVTLKDEDNTAKEFTVVVTIENVIEEDAVFALLAPTVLTTEENIEYKQKVIITGTPNGAVAWSLKEPVVKGFSIDQTGQLILASQDYEASEIKTRSTTVIITDEDKVAKELIVIITIIKDACEADINDPECDFDKDGKKNKDDDDDDGDGKTDEEENAAIPKTNSLDACDPDVSHDECDFDKDGKKNKDDLDDDNDGISDIDEDNASPKTSTTNPDSDGDGICDGSVRFAVKGEFKGCMPNTNPDPDADTDADEIKDTSELPGDSDGDSIPDYLDADGDGPAPLYGDSDNDGIDDKTECGPSLPCRDTDKDGTYDYLEEDKDSDDDGISDDKEADGIEDNGFDVTPMDGTVKPKDTDGDGVPDYRDTDSDGDGKLDKDENTPPGKDSDDDGIPDVVDNDDEGTDTGGGDSDGDGVTDEQECPNYPTNCPDTDNDGIPDYADNETDTDGDGITDSDEDPNLDNDNDPSTYPRDTDGDGTPDYKDTDSDGDGINDAIEGDPKGKDTDDDGIPDVVDFADQGPGVGDSDGDTILDDVECGAFPCRDTDSDGIPDYTDTDSDGDGIDDKDEAGNDPKNPKDTDGDGIPDVVDPVNGGEGEDGGDSDKDGVSDADECASWPNCSDTDRDGIPDYLDDDSSPAVDNPSPAAAVDLGTVKTGVHGAGNMSWMFVMLLSLMVLARRKFAFAIALPLIFSSLAVQAAWWDEMDFYAGAGYGQSYLDPAVGGTAYEVKGHTQDSWKLTGGWDWNDHISVEGYYSNLGSVELSHDAEMGYRMLGGDAMLHYWARGGERVRGSIALYAKAGLNHMTNNGNGVNYKSKNQGQLFGGIGAELYLPQKFSVRFEIESYDTDASLFSLNLVKRFGFKSRFPSLPPLPIVESKPKQEEQFIAMVEELPITAAGPKIVQLVPVVMDTDLDGLLDDEDQCPYTPKDVTVNQLGCATYDGEIGDLITKVKFEVNSALLTETSKIALNEIVAMLATYTAVKIEVGAHTDNTGRASYNKKLSQQRAESVVQYLADKKIVGERLMPIGYGEEQPIAGNKTFEGRAKNRRVEFILKSR